MVSIAGVPLLERVVRHLTQFGITDFILSAHYKAEIIHRYFCGLSIPGAHFTVVVEEQPLGTSGPLALLKDQLNPEFLVVYGDEFLDCDIGALIEDRRSSGALATVLVRPSHHPWDGHLFQTDGQGRVTGYARTFEWSKGYQNLGNLGVYAVSREILRYIPQGRKGGFAEDIFPALIADGALLRVHMLESSGYVKDVGNPARIQDVEKYLADKAAVQRAKRERQPIETVFLDRDGVIVEDTGLVCRQQDLRVLPGTAEALRMLNHHPFRTVVVTNQPQVARGLITEAGLNEIHDCIRKELAKEGAFLDAIYYCPHHPETQYAEGVPELRRGCDCRKPRAGMILRAKDDLPIDLAASVMIGDSSDDIEAGRNAGLRTILLRTPYGRVRPEAPQPDYEFPSLLDAARALARGEVV